MMGTKYSIVLWHFMGAGQTERPEEGEISELCQLHFPGESAGEAVTLFVGYR